MEAKFSIGTLGLYLNIRIFFKIAKGISRVSLAGIRFVDLAFELLKVQFG